MFAQAVTWSDYKKHNTVKYLIVIYPTGYIMFVSDGYGGRAGDAYICQDSSFYKKLEHGDEVMADRGFPRMQSIFCSRGMSFSSTALARKRCKVKEWVLRNFIVNDVCLFYVFYLRS